jgi:hypothetical protein
MPRPPLRPLPPRGSTEWAAQQFYRVLTDEERIAAERERLRALGWRPSRPANGSTPSTQFAPANGNAPGPLGTEPGFGEERDAYADLIEQDRAHRDALDSEARRRVSARLGGTGAAPAVSNGSESSPGWAGGRFGVPVPQSPAAALSAPLLQRISLTDRTDTDPTAPANDPKHVEVAAAPAVLALLAAAGLLGGYGAYEANRPRTGTDLPDFDFEFPRRDMVPPPPPAPPRDFDPEESRRIQRDFGGPHVNVPPTIDISPESFPIQEEIFPNILTGPDTLNPLQFPTWMESRRGGEPVRNLNNEIRSSVQGLADEDELRIDHIGGARDDKGREVAEVYLKGPVAGSRAGGSYIDIAFGDPDTLRRLHIQTVDTIANGTTPSRREYFANIRVIRNMKHGDIVVLIPKPRGGAVLDLEATREFLRPLLHELGQPVPEADPRSIKSPEDLWHLFK